MTKRKKSPQAPKGKWRYGVVKRTYKTMLPKETFSETYYELVEVYDQRKSYTAEAVSLTAESKEGLIRALTVALQDLDKYDVIIDRKAVVRKFGVE